MTRFNDQGAAAEGVFNIDIETCSNAGEVWIIACIEDTAAIRKIPDQLKSKDTIIAVLDDGECIAEYPDDDTCYVVTACVPDNSL